MVPKFIGIEIRKVLVYRIDIETHTRRTYEEMYNLYAEYATPQFTLQEHQDALKIKKLLREKKNRKSSMLSYL